MKHLDPATRLSVALQAAIVEIGERDVRDIVEHEIQHYRTRKELTARIYDQLLKLPEPDKGNVRVKLRHAFRGVRTINIALNTPPPPPAAPEGPITMRYAGDE